MNKLTFLILSALAVSGSPAATQPLFGDSALARLQASVPGTNLTAFGAHDASAALLAKGVEYYFVRFSSLYGHPVDAHFIRIPDPKSSVRMKICENALRPAGSRLQKTSVVASASKALFAINGNMFRWKDDPDFKPYYFTKVDGREVPSVGKSGSGLAFNADGSLAMGSWNAKTAAAWQNVFTCECVLRGGKSQTESAAQRKVMKGAGHPLIGTTKDGVLWFVVYDGRRAGISEGLSYHASALLLKTLGCDYGTLYDGGGSTTLAIRTSALPARRLTELQRVPDYAGDVTIMNYVSTNGKDWVERAVVDQLTVFEAP